MHNEKWIYIVIKNIDDIDVQESEIISAWRNETEAEDIAFELNEKETQEYIYFEVEKVLLQGWEIQEIED